jgi:uncharacterized protein (TIGR02271 family)
MKDRSIVAGVFTDQTQAQQAMRDLQNAGFSDDQIRYSVHRGGSGITDQLRDLGLSDDEADFYNSEFMAGRTVVTVKAAGREQEAYSILNRYGAYDASSRTGQTSYAQTGQAAYATDQAGYTTDRTDYTTEGGQKVRLREEELRANKERVQAGEVGIHKDVVTEEKGFDVPVQREEVYVERHPVSGDVPADTPIGEQDETYRVPVSEERVNVEKKPVVKEELEVGKRPVQETERVSDTVRREEARIDRSGDVDVQGDTDFDRDRS